VQAIQVANAEKHVVNHFSQLSEKRRALMLKDSLLTQILDSTFGNTVGLGTGFILILAAQSQHSTQLEIGDLALFIYYLTFVTDFTQHFGMFLAHYTQTKVSFQRMVALLQGTTEETLVKHAPLYLTGEVPELPSAISGGINRLHLLEASGLTYHYPDTGRGIDGASLRIEEGALIVITGRIASGKTTLLRVLLGLLPREAGVIRWNGNMVSDPASFFVPPQGAYTAQVP